MKIAYFLDSSYNYFGGATGTLLQQARIMKERHEVLVVLACDEQQVFNEDHKKRCLRLGLDYAVLPYATTSRMRDTDIASVIQNLDSMKRFLSANRFDFLHSVQLNPTVELAARELRVPHLMNVYQLEAPEFALPYPDIYAKYHSCDSELYCRVWAEGLGCTTKCIRTNVKMRNAKKRARDDSIIYFGMSGTIFAGKNQLTAIKLIEKCLAERVKAKLIIAGFDTSPYALMCKEYVKQHNLCGSVEIIGYTENIEEDLLNKIDVFLCVSTYESFPSSIVEALTMGIPVISTPVAGVPEIFVNGVNAYISAETGVEALWECVRCYMQDCESGKIEEIIKNAEETYQRHFSETVVREQLSDYYDFILADYLESKPSPIVTAGELLDFIKPLREKVNTHRQELGSRASIIERLVWHYSTYGIIFGAGGRAYIWGAGDYGQKTLAMIKALWENIEVVNFIDIKAEGSCCGLEIVNSDKADYEAVAYIFLAFAADKSQAIEYLAAKGKRYNIDVFVLF
ncbi:MAG: glycosyltransferase family 4 protein [Lachnospiraceae bacterium]|nr:glycosyltransferase family 4 protein [Lachnospiraceae bacterium]